jgi:2-iminoacetate synthase ThiH
MPENYAIYLNAGINDWGGVSPLTPDFINPEAPWPALEILRAVTEGAGHVLAPRLTVHPRYALDPDSVERPVHWARHLLRTRELQRETGGFTEFVGLPFVHVAALIYLKRAARAARPGERWSSCTQLPGSPTAVPSRTSRPRG